MDPEQNQCRLERKTEVSRRSTPRRDRRDAGCAVGVERRFMFMGEFGAEFITGT